MQGLEGPIGDTGTQGAVTVNFRGSMHYTGKSVNGVNRLAADAMQIRNVGS